MRRLKESLGSSTPEPHRLETPSMVGYRVGMSSSAVIGRKLSAVFGVERDVPREMDTALRELQTKIGRAS